MGMDATGSEPRFTDFFFFFKQTQERATCLHFCVQPQRRVSLALGTNVGLELDWPDRVLAAQCPWELALSQAAKFDCLKIRPSWPGGQLGHLAGAGHGCTDGAQGCRDWLQRGQVGWGLHLWGRAGPGHVLEGSVGLFCVESIFNVLII